MTLPEVAVQMRRKYYRDADATAREVIAHFEADPDFTLREGIEALLKSALIQTDPQVANALRALLEGKP